MYKLIFLDFHLAVLVNSHYFFSILFATEIACSKERMRSLFVQFDVFPHIWSQHLFYY